MRVRMFGEHYLSEFANQKDQHFDRGKLDFSSEIFQKIVSNFLWFSKNMKIIYIHYNHRVVP